MDFIEFENGSLAGDKLPTVLSLHGFNFRNASPVAILTQFGPQPRLNDLFHLGTVDCFAAQRENVCTIVFS
jgi:hypothetical protein